MAEKTTENNHEKVMQDLGAFVNETKVLVEKVMNMRVQCMEAQKGLLRLFDPKCIKIVEASNELSASSTKQVDRIKRIKMKRLNISKTNEVRLQPRLETIDLMSQSDSQTFL